MHEGDESLIRKCSEDNGGQFQGELDGKSVEIAVRVVTFPTPLMQIALLGCSVLGELVEDSCNHFARAEADVFDDRRILDG